MTAFIYEEPLQYQRTILVNQFQNLFLWLSHKAAGFDISEKMITAGRKRSAGNSGS